MSVFGFSVLPNEADLKKEYRKLSKMYHPDVGVSGDSEKFQSVCSAYEFLLTYEPPVVYVRTTDILVDFFTVISRAC